MRTFCALGAVYAWPIPNKLYDLSPKAQVAACLGRARLDEVLVPADAVFIDRHAADAPCDLDTLKKLDESIEEGDVTVIYFHHLGLLIHYRPELLSLVREWLDAETRIVSLEDGWDSDKSPKQLLAKLHGENDADAATCVECGGPLDS